MITVNGVMTPVYTVSIYIAGKRHDYGCDYLNQALDFVASPRGDSYGIVRNEDGVVLAHGTWQETGNV